MKDNIFSLVYSDYDTEEHYFFSGPSDVSQEEFKKLCARLLPKAGYKVVIKRQFSKDTVGDWVCWRDVVESLVSLLEEQGYQRISLDSYQLRTNGSIISLHAGSDPDPRLGFAGKLIADYNRKLEKKMAEERKIRRKLSGLLKKKTVQIIK